jgi:hypothetical protein
MSSKLIVNWFVTNRGFTNEVTHPSIVSIWTNTQRQFPKETISVNLLFENIEIDFPTRFNKNKQNWVKRKQHTRIYHSPTVKFAGSNTWTLLGFVSPTFVNTGNVRLVTLLYKVTWAGGDTSPEQKSVTFRIQLSILILNKEIYCRRLFSFQNWVLG